MNKQTIQITKFGTFVLGWISVYTSWSIGTYGDQPGLTPLLLMVAAGLLWGTALAITFTEKRAKLQQAISAKWLMILSTSTALLFAFLLPWIVLFALLFFVGMP